MIPSLPGVGAVWPLAADDDRTTVRPLDFVEVPSNVVRAGHDVPDGPATAEAATSAPFVTLNDGQPRWSLWGDPEA